VIIRLATTDAHYLCQGCGHQWLATELTGEMLPARPSGDTSDVLDIDAAMLRDECCARCGHQGIQRAGRSLSGVWVECDKCRYGWVVATRGRKRVPVENH